jgi:glycosyltransferase involved in cell wall biosynthesis
MPLLKNNMKASIVIPAYNEEGNIARTLEAVLNQDYHNFEVIVIDNASSDKTGDIARSFPVKVSYEPKKGTMSACERGRNEATGDIIVRMDADCLPETQWLKSGIKFFKNSGIVAVSGPYDYYDGSFMFRYPSLLAQKYIYRWVNETLRVTNYGGVMVGGNSFFRADALQSIGGFNTNITFYGDEIDTAKKLSLLGKILYDSNLIMKTSARRFKKEGTLTLLAKYWYYFLKGILTVCPKQIPAINTKDRSHGHSSSEKMT